MPRVAGFGIVCVALGSMDGACHLPDLRIEPSFERFQPFGLDPAS